MSLAKLTGVRWVYLGRDGLEMDQRAIAGWPAMILEFEDGRTALVGSEQKMLARGVRSVALTSIDDKNSNFKDVKVDIPEWKGDGRDAVTVTGATDNTEIVTLASEFLAALSDGNFEPRIIMSGAKDDGEETTDTAK